MTAPRPRPGARAPRGGAARQLEKTRKSGAAMIDIDAARARIDEWTRLAAWGISLRDCLREGARDFELARRLDHVALRREVIAWKRAIELHRQEAQDRTGNGKDHGPPLRLTEWLEREDIPELDLLLGSILSTTSRMLLVGPTGLGKTMFGLAVASRWRAGPASSNGAPAGSGAFFTSTAKCLAVK